MTPKEKEIPVYAKYHAYQPHNYNVPVTVTQLDVLRSSKQELTSGASAGEMHGEYSKKESRSAELVLSRA